MVIAIHILLSIVWKKGKVYLSVDRCMKTSLEWHKRTLYFRNTKKKQKESVNKGKYSVIWSFKLFIFKSCVNVLSPQNKCKFSHTQLGRFITCIENFCFISSFVFFHVEMLWKCFESLMHHSQREDSNENFSYQQPLTKYLKHEVGGIGTLRLAWQLRDLC